MKKIWRKMIKIMKKVIIAITVLILLFLSIRLVGKVINGREPKGGINESFYVDINGSKQWISIYGEDKSNPVLLYLHGGPGSATSLYDYAFTRKWADAYTVVTWDQRNCGKSYDEIQNNIELTYDLMMDDGVEMTRFLINYLQKEKINILGHSWGTYLGCNLVLSYPEYFDSYIGTGQMVDMYENEVAFREVATKWIDEDKDSLEMLKFITPEKMTEEYFVNRNLIMEKYGYNLMVDGTDYNLLTAIIFNPYYSLLDYVKFIKSDDSVYMNFLLSDEFNKFSLKEKTEYKVPYFNINGDRDYQTNYNLAQDYYDKINAPYKKIYIMKDTTHGLLESKSEEFSEIIHQIAKIQNKWEN